MSSLLAQFGSEFSKLADYLVASEGSATMSTPCPCGKAPRSVRCKECTAQDPVCKDCFLKSHESMPFHFAEVWNGTFFDRTSQATLGRVINLGHGGHKCPKVFPAMQPLLLDVVQLNGLHACKVHYCKCEGAGKNWEQLMQINLFPGTISKTATAYSFETLKHFDLLSSVSKTPALEYELPTATWPPWSYRRKRPRREL